MAVMLKGHNMPGWCACCTPERAEGQGPARRALRRQVRKRENREWRKDAEREIREAYYYDEDDTDEYASDLVSVGSSPWDYEGEIYTKA